MSQSHITDKSKPNSHSNQKISPLLIVFAADQDQEKLIQSIDLPETVIHYFSDISEGLKQVEGRALSTVIVDIKLSMKATPAEKEKLALIDSILPLIKIRSNPQVGVVSICKNQSGEGLAFLSLLLQNNCNLENTRFLRSYHRYPINLNILMNEASELNWSKALKANTLNLSYDGLFIVSVDEWQWQQAMVKLYDYPEIEPFRVSKKWSLPWGKSQNHFPGHGVQFVDLTIKQRELLSGLLK